MVLNIATSSNLIPAADILKQILDAITENKNTVIQEFWNILMSYLSEHLLQVILLLSGIFIISYIIALLGRWGMFGSVLYNYLYFGILFSAGLIWGPSIASNFVDLICLILYPICYLTVGIVLNKLGLRR